MSHKFLISSIQSYSTNINPLPIFLMAMKSLSFLAVLSLLALTLPLAIASDPSQLQDFCVSANTSANGGMYMMIANHFQ